MGVSENESFMRIPFTSIHLAQTPGVLRHKGENFVEVTFASQAVERIYTKDLTAEDILERINAVAEQMDMEEVM